MYLEIVVMKLICISIFFFVKLSDQAHWNIFLNLNYKSRIHCQHLSFTENRLFFYIEIELLFNMIFSISIRLHVWSWYIYPTIVMFSLELINKIDTAK